MLVKLPASDCILKTGSCAAFLALETGARLNESAKRSGWNNENEDNMTAPESPLEKALYPAVENVIERDYPNPNRDGCPGRSFLEKAAFFAGSLSAEENALVVQHVPKCWPCFKELKHLRKTAQARKDTLE